MGLVKLGDVRGKQQPPRGGIGPVPGGDVIEQVPDGQHGGVHDGRGDRPAGSLAAGPPAAPLPTAVVEQERLNVLTFQEGQAGDVRVLGVEEFGERQQVVDERLDRLRAQHGAAQRHVTHQGRA